MKRMKRVLALGMAVLMCMGLTASGHVYHAHATCLHAQYPRPQEMERSSSYFRTRKTETYA